MSDTSSNSDDQGVDFLQWALPRMGYRWDGFNKPRGQVLKRIQERMAELELSGGYAEYKAYLEEHPEEWKRLDNLCDVTISKFFRDRKLWDFLRDEILTELVCDTLKGSISNSEKVYIWSAGCCNGEEPYSLAIIYQQLMDSEEKYECKPVSILATDRNEEVLQRANKGCYPGGALKELKDEEVGTFLKKVVGKRESYSEAERKNEKQSDIICYEVKESLRENVAFEKRDIRNSMPEYMFDMVLCRNLVFTYFTEERQRHFLQRLKPHLNEGGYLVIGSNEQIPEVDWLEPISATHPILRREI